MSPWVSLGPCGTLWDHVGPSETTWFTPPAELTPVPSLHGDEGVPLAPRAGPPPAVVVPPVARAEHLALNSQLLLPILAVLVVLDLRYPGFHGTQCPG